MSAKFDNEVGLDQRISSGAAKKKAKKIKR